MNKVFTPDWPSFLQRYDKSRAHFSFKTQSLEAFTAFTAFTGYVHHLQENFELDDIGVTITREDNPDFKVIFPPGLNKELKSIIFTTINVINVASLDKSCIKKCYLLVNRAVTSILNLSLQCYSKVIPCFLLLVHFLQCKGSGES